MRNVLVTGGTRGLGLAIVKRLVAAGYGVIAVARRQSDDLATAVSAESGGSVHFKAFDLAETERIHDLVKSVRSEFGPIYGLVNNAGIGTGGVLATMPDAQMERALRINTLALMLLTKYVVRAMMTDGSGRIVNIASIVSFTGYRGLSVYSATKAAVGGFTRSLAREVGPLGINVNAVAPGFIDTEMTESMGTEKRERIVRRSALNRLATADDVAHAVEFLLDERSKNITGTTMVVDAGSTA